MATVERAELAAERQRLSDDQELRAIFAMQIPFTDADRVLVGAA